MSDHALITMGSPWDSLVPVSTAKRLNALNQSSLAIDGPRWV